MKTISSTRRLGAMAATALVATAGLLAPATPASADPPPLPDPNSHGITLQDYDEIAPRLLEADVRSTAVFAPGTNPQVGQVTMGVRIYLPAGYQPDRPTGYPVLYLFHGGNGQWSDWSDANLGNIASTLDGSAFPGIVVMPDGGRAGWYQDWASNTNGGFRPLWEQFHVDQLVPWVDANFNTTGDRAGRSIAGLSMGGYGALKYAARHPDLFSAVGSFSGGTDIRQADAQDIIYGSLVLFGARLADHGAFDPLGHYRLPAANLPDRLRQVFGDPAGWGALNPQDLADVYNAYDGRMAVYSGNTGSDEHIGRWNSAFHDALSGRGVQHLYCTGPGGHEWPLWRNDLRHFVDLMFGTPSAPCPNGWGNPQA